MDNAMDEDTMVTITRVEHPKVSVRLCELDADGSYFQRLWLPIAGPSVVALVNRSQDLTRRAGGRADITVKDLAQSLGIPGRVPKGRSPSDRIVFGKNGVLLKTLSRTHHIGLGRVHMGARSLQFVVYNQVAPLPARHMDRLPEFLRQDHWNAMEPVAVRLAEHGLDLGAMTDIGPNQHRPPGITPHDAAARLEHLRNQPPGPPVPAHTVAPVTSI